MVSIICFGKYVVPWQSQSGVKYGLFKISLKFKASLKCVECKIFNQKLGTWSIPGDFHLWDLFNVFMISSKLILFQLCSEILLLVSLKSLIHLAFSLFFSLLQVFFQNPLTWFSGGILSTRTIFFPISR